MAKNRVVNSKFWDDNYIITLKPIEKLLFLYFLTNPLTNICGAYEISTRRICFDTGIMEELLVTILTKFKTDKKIVYRDGWVIIHNFIKNQSLNPSIRASIKESLINMPEWITKIIGSDSLGTAWVQPVTSNLNLSKSNLIKSNAVGTDPVLKKNETPGTERKKAPASFQAMGEILKHKKL